MFNYQNFIYTNEGIANYYWPVNRDKISDLISKMTRESTFFLKNNSEIDLVDNLKLINMYLILKMANLYQRKILSDAIKNSKSINLDTNIFKSFKNNNSIVEKDYLIYVRNGFRKSLVKKYKFQNIRNLLATKIRNDGFIRAELNDVNFSNDIVSLSPSILGAEYLKKTKKQPYLIKIADFFPGVTSDDLKKVENNKKDLKFDLKIYDDYIQLFITIFKENNLDITEIELRDIFEWNLSFMAYIKYYQKLLAKNQFLPSKLWTGSAGILFNKLIAIEVRKKGGFVTIFDHAEGANLTINTSTPFIELQEADEFITRSKTFVNYLTDASIFQLYHDNCPSIISIK